MDPTHPILGGLLIIAIPIIGFRGIFKRTEKDDAIDASVFLALRDLRAWLERTRAERSE